MGSLLFNSFFRFVGERTVNMQKITSDIALEISRRSGRETYYASPFFLTASCFYEQDRDGLHVYIDDPTDHETRLLFPPRRPVPGRIPDVQCAWDSDIAALEGAGIQIFEKISYESEYICSSRALTALEGSGFSKFRQKLKFFKKNFSYCVLSEYDPEKVRDFIRRWGEAKDLSAYPEMGRKFFLWDLELCQKYVDYTDLPQKNIFVEIDGTLAGFAYTHPLTPRLSVALMQKVNTDYPGITQFLYQETAKLYPEVPFFTAGPDCATPGQKEFKQSLRPAEVHRLYLLKMGESAKSAVPVPAALRGAHAC